MVNGQIAFSDLVKQCTMYSCDMGIHFYKSGCLHSLPKGILRTIKSVCVAMQKAFHLSTILITMRFWNRWSKSYQIRHCIIKYKEKLTLTIIEYDHLNKRSLNI